MKRLITIYFAFLTSLVSAGVQTEYKLLDGMLCTIAETLEVKHPSRFLDGTKPISKKHRFVEMKHRYRWSNPELVGETKMQEIVEALATYIAEIEESYPDYKCANRSFMFKKHADDYTAAEIPSFSLSFSNVSDRSTFGMTFRVQFIHTSPKILFLNATSIEPIISSSEQDAEPL